MKTPITQCGFCNRLLMPDGQWSEKPFVIRFPGLSIITSICNHCYERETIELHQQRDLAERQDWLRRKIS